jgi:hypothetical protein
MGEVSGRATPEPHRRDHESETRSCHALFAARGHTTARAALTVLEGAAVAFAIAGFAWLAAIYLRMMVSPAPQEMREGAPIVTTLALLELRNPYAPGALAQAGNLCSAQRGAPSGIA